MESIKLVIWDLDETFWGGTLTEGGIQYRPPNHEIVLELSRRGVVNSVCSKNDLATARDVLVEHEIWDYFVFPKIAWTPKGQMIAQTLEEMGLRAPNVLFVDDNPQNLEEAKYYNPGIQVALPESLASLLSLPAVRGKADTELSRLKQYQLLEKKVGDRQQFESTNEDFLRQCNIEVTLRRDCHAVFQRLLEMIQRTNQLNFTKKHLDVEGLRRLIDDPAYQCGYVKVQDRYGDYGIAGFYAVEGQRLEQFLFSCRVLNMGVERWLYDHLGRPALTIAGDVSDDPTLLPPPNWIQVADSPCKSGPNARSLETHPRVILKGGCDLDSVIVFLGGRESTVTGEFNYVTAVGAPVHFEHSEILRRWNPASIAGYAEVYARLPFFDERTYHTSFLGPDYDVYVYSTLMDMSNGLYRHRGSDWVLPYGDFQLDITDESNWDWVLSRNEFLTRDFLAWFREQFAFEGCLSEAAFADNLSWLCEQIPADKQLILLNGAEIPLAHRYEHDRHEHHRRMNAVIAATVDRHPHVELCDVRKFANSPSDVSNNIRHYRRKVYYQIAGELGTLIVRRWSLKSSPTVDLFRASIAFASQWRKRAQWAVVKPLLELWKGSSTNRGRQR